MILHRARRFLFPYIHRNKDYVGDELGINLYAKYSMYEREFICKMDVSVEEARDIMDELGFSYEPVAALKVWENTGRVEDGSYVKRDEVDGPYQHHVHIFFDGDGVIFAGHFEYSWMPRPLKHYKGKKMEYDKTRDMFFEELQESDLSPEEVGMDSFEKGHRAP